MATDRFTNHHQEPPPDPVVETYLERLISFPEKVQQVFLEQLDLASSWIPRSDADQSSAESRLSGKHIRGMLQGRFNQALSKNAQIPPEPFFDEKYFQAIYEFLIGFSPQQVTQIVQGLLAHKEAIREALPTDIF